MPILFSELIVVTPYFPFSLNIIFESFMSFMSSKFLSNNIFPLLSIILYALSIFTAYLLDEYIGFIFAYLFSNITALLKSIIPYFPSLFTVIYPFL